MLEENVREIEKKFDEGQQIFRRKSVEILLARIQQLEIAAQQSVQLTGGTLPDLQALFDHEILSGLEADTTPPTSN